MKKSLIIGTILGLTLTTGTITYAANSYPSSASINSTSMVKNANSTVKQTTTKNYVNHRNDKNGTHSQHSSTEHKNGVKNLSEYEKNHTEHNTSKEANHSEHSQNEHSSKSTNHAENNHR